MFDPDKAFQEMEKAAEEMAETEYQASLLEELKPVMLAQLISKLSDFAFNRAEVMAKADPVYEGHIKGMVAARQKANRARARYKNLQALFDGRRTVEASTRAMTR